MALQELRRRRTKICNHHFKTSSFCLATKYVLGEKKFPNLFECQYQEITRLNYAGTRLHTKTPKFQMSTLNFHFMPKITSGAL